MDLQRLAAAAFEIANLIAWVPAVSATVPERSVAICEKSLFTTMTPSTYSAEPSSEVV